jgi:hypothetical protein
MAIIAKIITSPMNVPPLIRNDQQNTVNEYIVILSNYSYFIVFYPTCRGKIEQTSSTLSLRFRQL